MSIIPIQVLEKWCVRPTKYLRGSLVSYADSLELLWSFSMIFACAQVVTPIRRTDVFIALYPDVMISWYYNPKHICEKTDDKAHGGYVGSKWLSFILLLVWTIW